MYKSMNCAHNNTMTFYLLQCLKKYFTKKVYQIIFLSPVSEYVQNHQRAHKTLDSFMTYLRLSGSNSCFQHTKAFRSVSA